MICPKCKDIVEMDIGAAIQHVDDDINANVRRSPGHDPTIRFDTMQIISCWKCPECGHSTDKKDRGP